MSAANLYTPAQPTDSTAHHERLTTTAGGQKTTTPNTVQMTRAEWAATPRDYKISSRKTGRFVMRHSPHGIGLFPVILID